MTDPECDRELPPPPIGKPQRRTQYETLWEGQNCFSINNLADDRDSTNDRSSEQKGEQHGKHNQACPWDLNGPSIEEMIDDISGLKRDKSLPMPHIEVDPSNPEDFEQYAKDSRIGMDVIKQISITAGEEADTLSIVYLEQKCTGSMIEL